jgi:hemolysin activation/secretion protein
MQLGNSCHRSITYTSGIEQMTCGVRHVASVLSLPLLMLAPHFTACAHATVADPDPAPLLLQEQRAHAREQLRRPGAPEFPRPVYYEGLGTDPRQVSEPGVAVLPATIDVVDNGLLPLSEVEQVLTPFRDLPIGARRADLLLRRLRAALVQRGLITSHARLLRADIAARILAVELVPGRIETLQVNGAPIAPGMRYALGLREGEVLQLSSLEQAVEQINRLRMNRAEVHLLPGQTSGSTVVDVRLERDRPWQFSLGMDNHGQRSIGVARVRTALTVEDRLGWQESLALATVNSERSRAWLFSGALPHGFSTYSLTLSGSAFHSPIDPSVSQSGGSRAVAAGWNRVLQRSAVGKDSVDLTLTRTHAHRRVDELQFSPQILSVARLGFTRLHRGPDLQTVAEIAFARGLPLLGTTRDAADPPASAPHAQFDKLEAHLHLAVAIGDSGLTYLAQADAQTTATALYGQEQLRLGGAGSVRGFAEAALAGDRGFALRQELRFAPAALPGVISAQWEPFALADFGAVAQVEGAREHLASVGVGMRLFLPRRGHAELVLAKPVAWTGAVAEHGWRLHAQFHIEF